ncbi:hypothetical protein ACHWQZ_G009967 [Mnemiopsis leidyi]
MGSEIWRLLTAFLGGCLFVSFIFACLQAEFPQNNIQTKHKGRSYLPRIFNRPALDPAFNLDLNPHKKLIIVLAAFRSGSTFLGNLFDSNPTMQYMFEPFHSSHIRNLRARGALIGARSDHTESDLRMLYLQQMLHNCTVYLTPFPEKYQWCGTAQEHLHRFNTTDCPKAMLGNGISQQEICRYRKTTVIKVIRLEDLKDILKIAQIKSADVQVIQLLRHPVALMMSRRTGGKFFMWDSRTMVEPELLATGDVIQRRTKMAWEAFNYCYNHVKAMEFVESDPWLKERYLRVSHHEMSLKPLETAERVYSFIGEKLTDHIREYIRNITGAESEGFKNAPKHALNVYRNSTEIVNKWKDLVSSTVKYWDVFSIEYQCKRMFGPLIHEFTVDKMADLQLGKINSNLLDEMTFKETENPTTHLE